MCFARNTDDEKLVDRLEQQSLDHTHALISPKQNAIKNNVLLQNHEEIENLELISEMGNDEEDRNLNPSPMITPNLENIESNPGHSPTPIDINEDIVEHKDGEIAKENDEDQKVQISNLKLDMHQLAHDTDDDESELISHISHVHEYVISKPVISSGSYDVDPFNTN